VVGKWFCFLYMMGMLCFDEILGQDRAIGSLQSAVESGHVHHAWIFHGPGGVGKFTTARAFGALLLDPDARVNLAGVMEAEQEGRCVRLIASGNHPDFHVINKELAVSSRSDTVRRSKQANIPKEVVLEFLVEPASRSGHGGKDVSSLATKCFIVDEAESLAREGQNVLLKTLEEPPAGTVIILVTSQLDKLLPTIRSRCQRVGFVPLGEKDMGRLIKRFVDENGVSDDERRRIGEDERGWLVRFSAGSPGMARMAIENNLYSWYEEIAPQLRGIWGGRYPEGLGKRLAKMVGEFSERVVKGNKNASKDAANKLGARLMFSLIGTEMQHGLHNIINAGGEPDRILYMIDLLQEAEGQLNAHIHMEMIFDNLIIQWATGRNAEERWLTTAGI